MKISRRAFLAAALAGSWELARSSQGADAPRVARMELDKILNQPVLTTDFVKEPVTVASIELLVNGRNFLVRTRSTAGVEVVTVPNPERMAQTYPIFLKSIVPVFLKQDARKLESLLWDVYRYNSNYKLQGIALWAGVAAIEMALLEL